MSKTRTAPTPAAVKHFADARRGIETDRSGFLAAVAENLAQPPCLTKVLGVSVSGVPCLAELVNPFTWRLSYRKANGDVGRRFVQTTNPERLETEALRVATDLAADLGVGFANVTALATV